MGMVLLDVEFRTERAFGIRIPRRWLSQVSVDKAGDAATLEDFHQFIRRLCVEQQVPVPEDSWPRLVEVICAASGIDESELGQDTRLIKDIAPFG